MKLNIGCGMDYREGFINIDGSGVLPRVDKVIDLSQDSLDRHFDPNSIDHILCNDFLEHFFHWEAVELLEKFFAILKREGTVEIRVPDSEWIINSDKDMEWKLRCLYGGQDNPQKDNKMNFSRKEYPQFFCHKYGWSQGRLRSDLGRAGFTNLQFQQARLNFIATAKKHEEI